MWVELLVIGIKLAWSLAGVLLTTVPIMVWVERRGAAFIQDRLGPNRVGPFGLFQPVVDAVKLIFKEDVIPADVNSFLYILAPVIAMSRCAVDLHRHPLRQRLRRSSSSATPLRGFIVAPDLNIGVLYIFAIASLGVYGDRARGLVVQQQVLAARRAARLGADSSPTSSR